MTASRNISSNLKKLRLQHGYSQEYLASKLFISQSSYQRLEKGSDSLLKYLKDLASIYDVPTYEIIGILPALDKNNSNGVEKRLNNGFVQKDFYEKSILDKERLIKKLEIKEEKKKKVINTLKLEIERNQRTA